MLTPVASREPSAWHWPTVGQKEVMRMSIMAEARIHTLAWVSIESWVAYVLWAGFAGRSDKRAGMAAAVVAGETLVFAGNGFRCPLTVLAERYGAEVVGALRLPHAPTAFQLSRWGNPQSRPGE